MTILRRFFLLQFLILWQGGFLFYASFVVPTGTEVLGSRAAQGAITARVTESLNGCGVAALAAMGWDLLATRTRSRSRWACWLIAVAGQAALFVLHAKLTGMMNAKRTFVVNHEEFYSLHAVYLWTSTAIWAACLAFAVFTILAWRRGDQAL